MASVARPASLSGEKLHDPHRVAAARRLLLEVPGPAAFDRLCGLAARLLGASHAMVTLFTDEDTVVGSSGPPPVAGGPAAVVGALSAVVIEAGGSLVVPRAGEDGRMAHLQAVSSGAVGAYLGVPLTSASGHAVGVLAASDASPRAWSDDAAALLEQFGASVVAELELSAAQSLIGASAARLEIALEASSVGIWERDLRTGVVAWDERCAAIFGYDQAMELRSVDELMRHIHPDDRDLVREPMWTAPEGSGGYALEARVLRADGEVRWTVSRGRVMTDPRGEPVRVLGTTVDVTEAREQYERRLSAVQRAAAIAEVAAQVAGANRIEELADITLRGAQVLGAESGGVALFDPSGALRVFLGRRLIDAVEAETREAVPAGGVKVQQDDSLPTQHVARHGEPIVLGNPEEAANRFPRMAEVTRTYGVRALAALPLRIEDRLMGSFVATWTTDHDFTDEDMELLEGLAAQIALSVSRLRADAERATAVAAMTEANQRLQLLADAGRVLSGSLDITRQIGQIAELLVPALGDWCWIVVTDEQGRLHDLASAHRDRARRAELERYVESMVAVMTDAAGARVVMRTGQPLVLRDIGSEGVAAALPDPAARESLDRLGAASGAIVPLVARGQTLGALGLFRSEDRAPHTRSEIDTAVEIGRRAGLALHHARLYSQQRDLAAALQHSMLTAPPEPDDCEIVVRYVPAAEGAEIGGDWYDAFLQSGGGTVLAIGDVAGHDTRAAAAMGQLRGLLRGIGYSSGGTPAEILSEVDRVAQGLALDIMATALVGRLEESEADLRAGRTWFRWSSAGHPLPVVIDAAGDVVLLDGTQPDLLLGVAPDMPRGDHVLCLPRGATVLLYTDGLVERRDRDVDAGTTELIAVLRECAGLPLPELCDRVLERMFLPDAEDDVALLAVRLHPKAPSGVGPPIRGATCC